MADATGAAEAAEPHREFHQRVDDFAIADAGPFVEFQQRLGVLRAKAGAARRLAVGFVAVAFGVPLLLSIAEGHALHPEPGNSFLLDLGVWARFVLAIAIFFLMERMVDERLRQHLRQFAETPLLSHSAIPQGVQAVNRALRRRELVVPELVCLLLAYGITLVGIVYAQDSLTDSWLVQVGEDGARMTASGWWVALVSSPIFWFLLFRWLWRHLVWALLLAELARLDLRLVVTHPDGLGGIAFISQYPNAFTALVLAMSCTLAAAMANAFQHDALGLTAYGYLMAAWLAFVLALFGLPLTVFVQPLAALKKKALLESSAGATRHFRAAERAALGGNVVADDDSEDTAAADHPNTSATYLAAKKMGTLPFSREALVPLAGAAILPLVLAGSTRLPFAELWKVAKRLLLL